MFDTITGTVTKVTRHGHTVNGNPMMSVDILLSEPFKDREDSVTYSSGILLTFRVSNDASLVYAIENSEYRESPHTFALTRAGRISHVVAPRTPYDPKNHQHAHAHPAYGNRTTTHTSTSDH